MINVILESVSTIDLGLLGIILSLISIWITIKPLKKYEMVHAVFERFRISDNLFNRFEQIKIQFKDSGLISDLFYVKGVIVNTGDYDIPKDDPLNRIEIIFPEDCHVYEAKLAETDHRIYSECCPSQEESNVINLDFGLLKKKECVVYEAIVGFEGGVEIPLKCQHRIVNLPEIKTQRFPYIEEDKFKSIFIALLLILTLIGYIPVMLYFLSTKNKLIDDVQNHPLNLIVLIGGPLFFVYTICDMYKGYKKSKTSNIIAESIRTVQEKSKLKGSGEYHEACSMVEQTP